jgi:ribonuclease BN (tRNA processing enzyme)
MLPPQVDSVRIRSCRRMARAASSYMRKILSSLPGLMLAAIPTIVSATPALAENPGSAAAGMELLVLGSGGPGAAGRASSSYVLFVDGMPRILIDAGAGSFVRLGEAHVDLDGLDVVLLTHLHVDHAAELPGIVKARAVATSHPIHFDVFGPEGRPAQGDVPFFPSTRRFMQMLFGTDGAFAYLKDFAAPVSFTVTNLPRTAHAVEPEAIYKHGNVAISAQRGHHDDAPAVIYRIDVGGRSIVFSGDIDAHGLAALETIARGADLLVFDAVVLDPPGSPAILYSLHSPPRAIGELAARAHVGRLLLSHLSAAVDGNRPAVTASIAAYYAGPVAFASDGLRTRP